ncbi:MAG: preprotein translocase subunit SecG [Chitinophagaceae bacterium]
MVIVFVILIVVACAVLGFIVLVQNPKGGGLAANIGGISNQFMGVKQTTDVLEKGTWIFFGIVALLCLFSTAFIPNSVGNRDNLLDKLNTKPTNTSPAPATTPSPALPAPITPAPGGTQK